MKVTTLLGSAKKKGNTATVSAWVEEELKSRPLSIGGTPFQFDIYLKNVTMDLGQVPLLRNQKLQTINNKQLTTR